MDAAVFWDVIGAYNSQTIIFQVGLVLFLVVCFLLSYTHRVKWAAKLALGAAHLYIGVVFFGVFGTEPIQKFFALPLYLCCGLLFLIECIKNKEDTLERPDLWHSFLLVLCVLYPAISYTLGNTFPQMVTYIMPCPVVCLGIIIYSGYHRRNRLLLLLLTIWGLTGIKSVIFSAYEDIILLICGIYGICLMRKDGKKKEARLS